ncbi:dNA polymerase III polC-type [Eubacterium sp. CAG:603]|nr:dNA polymerase III polC-type [Eubacterium sp. CAG:603]
MESKRFFEVFDGIKVDAELLELFSDIMVKRIVNNRAKSSIRIYIESNRLIHKSDIYKIEKAVASMFNDRLSVKIIEHYNLSSQYNSENLFNMYKDSIMLELYNYSIMEYSILNKAEITFDNDIMNIKLDDTVIAEEKSSELKRILEKIFNERCGITTEVRYNFEEVTELKYEKINELKMQQEVASIISNIKSSKSNKNADAVTNGQSDEKLPKPDKVKNDNSIAAKKNNNSNNSNGNGYDKSEGGFKKREGGFNRSFRRSDNPDVLYGRDFEGQSITLREIEGEMGEVIVRGQVIDIEERPIRNERTILSIVISDFTDSIVIKLFMRDENLKEFMDKVKKGMFIKVKGITTVDKFDNDLIINSVSGIMKISDFTVKRLDTSVEKRVELHCHTKLSDMDGVADVKDLIARAKEWGHTAMAITDHGVVQGFTEAWHALQKLEGKFSFKEMFDFKMIYGVEAYLVDDLKTVVTNSKNQSLDDDYVVFDIETTGFSPLYNKIIEIGAVKVSKGEIVDKFSTFVNPEEPIPYRIEQLTSINDGMVIDAPAIDKILPEFLKFCEGAVMVAHNADFDMSFIISEGKKLGIERDYTIVDTVALARMLLPHISKYKLDNVAKALNVSLENHHRAVDDAGCTAEIFVKFIEMLKVRDIFTLDGINEMGTTSVERIKKLPTHHAIILATNEVGRVHLYELISNSNIEYFNRQPRIPKSDYLKHKEGLIIGSACEAGELYQALVGGKSEEEITRLVEFYDYLEIQPIGNNEFMLESDKYSVTTIEELQDINRRIVKLGEQFNKLVVATCDVHFLDPQDEVYRRIIMACKGFKDADKQAPLYFRSTDEMLEEFKYLGTDKAYEVVVTNTNKIADMVENMFPVCPDKCPPVIENSDQILRDICYDTAHKMYGENLPEIVTERLERELNSIISNGFAVMYIIAQKLVWKSNEDGYLVGSRGSVGSSFVATMAGITEVNPLSPHYYCKKCHFYDFDSPEVKKYTGGAGCDMPDRKCPDCGEELVKAGFDIPFETFLGFKGNKEPDIDLNFSGEYQSKAHEYTEVIFGKGQTFRAGTIGTVAEKTAEAYVRKYCEERGIKKRRCEVTRISKGCTGVRRTTGQHPGGIIVLPIGHNINTFTPVQHPANDMTTKTVTTHFDYHSIDHNLLKLDILGHDDPTMIRMLEDITGLDAKNIPLDNKEVMSLFASTEALGIKPEDIGGCPLGALGIPEFGTDFVIQMLIDTKPQTFSDLVRISGLSHGTDVWLNNAQTVILNGDATISTAICTRDDIMIYLINKGLESEQSFTIMESVRKGKGLKPEWIEEMKKHDVPQWYIDSCLKIKYMFPKAHAAAYVMMAYRIAYFKVFYPLAYYAAYFSIRASAFSYEYMCMGRERLEYYMADFKKRKETKQLSNKEEDMLKDMKLVQEMYARGFEFEPIDLYRVAAHKFQIFGNKLMPALSTIEGMGDKAADAVVDAALDGPFLSKDDLRERSKASKTVVDLMDDLGILGDIPESNQISLFDFM